MFNPDEIDLKLKSLGLTQYEIKTLKTLIILSVSTAEEIHKQTDIPTPRIYDTIDSLEKKGFVRVVPGRPKRFEIVNLEKALQEYIKFKDKEYKEELEKLSSVSKNLISILSDPEYQSSLIIKPDELLEAHSSLEEMQLKTKEIIEKAKKEICIFTNVFYWFNQVEKEIENALKRKVIVRVLMSTEDEKSKEFAKKLIQLGVLVKSISEGNVLARGTLVDQEQVVFVIWVSPVRHEKYVYRPHFSSNSGIIEIFSNNFEFLWEKGKKITL